MSEARIRPQLHFTADRGWTNDPHGIMHIDGRYHMFFQYNPQGVVWSEACHWGQALSDDLVSWRETDVALAPLANEIGCWSGSAVVDATGPVLAYTRVAQEDWGRGSVALARPTSPMSGWVRLPESSVLAGPPDQHDIIAFRDPQLRRRGDGWVAVIGAGLVAHGGCALQYGVSGDLTHWEFESILASRANQGQTPVWSGKVWECPQFLQVDEQWVLLVSVWDDDVLHNVVYAIGDYDGSTFEPTTWGTFSHGPQLYATTTFTDAQGRKCAMSWLRERDNTAPAGSPWCSAMSLPHVLSVVAGRLVVTQHPSLNQYVGTELAGADLGPTDQLTARVISSSPWRVCAELQPLSHLVLRVEAGGSGWTLSADAGEGSVTVLDRDGAVLLNLRSPHRTGGVLDVLADADILEVTWSAGEGVGAVRVSAPTEALLTVTAERGKVLNARVLASRHGTSAGNQLRQDPPSGQRISDVM
jgi:beta-fructofuranosidase